jgi:hypothetical protein
MAGTTRTRKTPTKNEKTTAFYKVDDWYATHNFGTRFAMITFMIVYVIVVLTQVDFTTSELVDVNATKVVATATTQTANLALVKTTGYFAFAAFVVVTLGDNALSKIGDILVKYKEAKKG